MLDVLKIHLQIKHSKCDDDKFSFALADSNCDQSTEKRFIWMKQIWNVARKKNLFALTHRTKWAIDWMKSKHEQTRRRIRDGVLQISMIQKELAVYCLAFPFLFLWFVAFAFGPVCVGNVYMSVFVLDLNIFLIILPFLFTFSTIHYSSEWWGKNVKEHWRKCSERFHKHLGCFQSSLKCKICSTFGISVSNRERKIR